MWGGRKIMLINFTVTNHLSFRDSATLNMTKTLERQLPSHVYESQESGYKLLRGAVIYGANAAGKSNLIHCLQAARDFIVLDIEIPQRKAFKLSTEHRASPSRFDFEFVIEGNAYSYGFDVFEGKVTKEWLYDIEFKKAKKLIFCRTSNNNIVSMELGKRIQKVLGSKSKQKSLEDLIRSTLTGKLALSDLNNRNLSELIGDKAAKFLLLPYQWFSEKLEITRVGEKADPYDLERLLESNDENFRSQVEKVLNASDTGISRIKFQEYLGDTSVLFPSPKFIEHFSTLSDDERAFIEIGRRRYLVKKENDQLKIFRMLVVRLDDNGHERFFELNEESEGTRRIIDLVSLFLRNKTDRTLIIDEMDRSLHPTITKMFHEMHYATQNNNQLIIATHEHYLLSQDFYRRDEIWFADKDKTGNTKLYSLSDYDPDVRFDKDIRKDYLQGRYGAVPRIGNL